MLLACACISHAGTLPLDRPPEDFRRVINCAKETVFPSVVYLRAVLEDFEMGKRTCRTVGGSGFIISPEGEVVTNWHVVAKAMDVRCLLNDGRSFDAAVVGSDKDTDLALLHLKLPAGDTVPCAELGDSAALGEGDFVMAMGAPWGLNRSISFGIISCCRRYLPGTSEYSTWLQTDASISPGNSGGPLVDTSGHIVGVNARGVTAGGDMGFAIPAETVRLVLPRLREHGDAGWSWTGLQLQPLFDFERNIQFPGDKGVIVAGIDKDSPASEAGFQANDRLVKIGGTPVTAFMEEDLPNVRQQIATLAQGVAVSIQVIRGDVPVTLQLTPRLKGRVLGEELECRRWDFTVKSINQFESPDLHYARNEGVYVHGIRSLGNAARSGLQVRDILVSVNGQPVRSLDDIRKIHQDSTSALGKGGSHRLVLQALRNGRTLQIVIDLTRDVSAQN